MSNRKLADRLSDLRNEKKITQTELAKILGKSKQIISFYENGDKLPSVETLEKYADFFGVSTDYLLGRTDTRTPETSIQAVCDYTHLAEKSIEVLRAFAELDSIVNSDGEKYTNIDIINILLESFGENAGVILKMVELLNFDNKKPETSDKFNSVCDDFHAKFPDAYKWAEGKLYMFEKPEFCGLLRRSLTDEWTRFIRDIATAYNPTEYEVKNNFSSYKSSFESVYAQIEFEKDIKRIKEENEKQHKEGT